MNKKNKYRNTYQKEIVLDTVRSMHNHPTAEEVYNKVAIKNSSISKSTVYRNLNILADSGEIKKVLTPGIASDRYDFNIEKHDHAVCSVCGKIFDVVHDMDYNKLNIIVNEENFSIKDCNVVVTGKCFYCK